MPGSTPLRDAEHATRANQHEQLGRLLAEAGHEWAAVPLFYAAYHIVKRALLTDPIFEHVDALHALHVDLMADDRFTTRHKGRRRGGPGGKEWGLNELVQLLYRPAIKAYEQLHQASIQVRYGNGLPSAGVELPALVEALDAIRELESNGALRAPLPWDDEA